MLDPVLPHHLTVLTIHDSGHLGVLKMTLPLHTGFVIIEVKGMVQLKHNLAFYSVVYTPECNAYMSNMYCMQIVHIKSAIACGNFAPYW